MTAMSRLFTKKYKIMLVYTFFILIGIRLIWITYVPGDSNLSFYIEAFTITIFLIHFVYACIFLLITENKTIPFYFALIVLFAALSISISDSRILLQLIPMSDVFLRKLISISYTGIIVFILLFLQEIEASDLKKRFTRPLLLSYIAMILLVICIPIDYYFLISTPIMFINIAAYLYALYYTLQIAHSENQDMMPLVFACLCSLTNIIIGSLKTVFDLYHGFYPLDFIFTTIAFAIFLFKQSLKISKERYELATTLKRINQKKDDFLANTSHELRNPLHSIVNIAETAKMRANQLDAPFITKDLDLLISVSRHMSSTLNDLLDLSAIHEGKLQLYQKNLHIYSLSSSTVDVLSFMSKGKNITIEMNIPTDFPSVYADEHRLTQIMFNLIHNAIKFTQDGGLISIYAKQDGAFATIHISDTGIGMDSEAVELVFQPYEQGKNKSISGGLGLGLSICKQLVRLQGGEISAHSVIDEGTTFSFSVPLTKETTATDLIEQETAATIETEHSSFIGNGMYDVRTSVAPIAKEVRNHQHLKLLIVDDDPINLRILNNLFAEEYNVTAVTSAEKALSILQRGSDEWDLIISDIMMPDMSGYEFIRKVRQRYSISELPILLLTARTKPEDLYTGFEAGANDYVEKPMVAMELSARVHALITVKNSINERLKMEAAWLQAQIQPHFLFNTLNTIASLSHIDTDRMVKLLTEFGNYLRHSFHVKNIDTVVPFEQEIALIKSYLYIEKERFGARLQIDWQIDEQLDIMIPPLSIQPLVENAVRHGVLQKIEGGTVIIKTEASESYIRITIKDDGVGMSQEKLEQIINKDEQSNNTGIGVWNTNRRLIQIYGKGLDITSTQDIGTKMSFNIPN